MVSNELLRLLNVSSIRILLFCRPISSALQRLMFTFCPWVSFRSSGLSFIHFRHFPVSYCFPLCYHSIICFLHDQTVVNISHWMGPLCSWAIFTKQYDDSFWNNNLLCYRCQQVFLNCSDKKGTCLRLLRGLFNHI